MVLFTRVSALRRLSASFGMQGDPLVILPARGITTMNFNIVLIKANGALRKEVEFPASFKGVGEHEAQVLFKANNFLI